MGCLNRDGGAWDKKGCCTPVLDFNISTSVPPTRGPPAGLPWALPWDVCLGRGQEVQVCY